MPANPLRRLHPLNLPFALQCRTARAVSFTPKKLPRTVFSCEVTLKTVCSVMIMHPLGDVSGLTYVKLAAVILQHVHPEHKLTPEKQKATHKVVAFCKIGSAGRARTYNPSVNSRMLYH